MTYTATAARLGGVALLIASLALTAADRGPAVTDYSPENVAENVYVIHGPIHIPNPDNQGFMNNPGIVVTRDGVVILDPGGTVQSGEMVLRAVRTLSDKPVVAVFNSHIHGDHWLGNQAIRAAYPDAAIYAHPKMIEMVEEGEGAEWIALMLRLTEGKSAGTGVVGPNKPVTHGDEIEVGEFRFHVHHHGAAHTTGDIMVEVKEASVVFLGDNVLNGRIARIDDGDVLGNIHACDEILKVNAKVYVPGHG